MNPEEQARKLAEWLDSHPGSDPPVGLDPDVVEAVYALRPDLAPAPRVSADDILASVTTGPLSAGWTPDAEPVEEDEAPRAAVVPFPAPPPKPEPVTRPLRRWAFGAGAGTLLAMAAAALLIVRTVTQQDAEPSPAMQATEAQGNADGTVESRFRELGAKEKEQEEASAPEVAEADEGDFVDDVAGLPDDGRYAVAHDSTITARPDKVESAPLGGAAGTSSAPRGTVALDASGDESQVATDMPMAIVAAPPRPTPTPRPAPGPVVATPSAPPTMQADPVARAPSSTTPGFAQQGAYEPEVADLGEEDAAGAIRGDTYRNLDGLEQSLGATTATGSRVATDDAEEMPATEVATAAKPSRAAGGRDRDAIEAAGEPMDSVAESRSGASRREQERRDAKERPGEGMAAGPGQVALAATPPSSDLDSLRSRAVPADLPQGELLSRSGTEANLDANELGAEGRYIEAGNALLPTVTLPAPQGSTNAAQAATWYLAAPDPTLAKTAAEAGLANTSGNTPERAWLWVLYGDALREAGDPSGAARAYGEAVQLNDARLGGEPASNPASDSPGR